MQIAHHQRALRSYLAANCHPVEGCTSSLRQTPRNPTNAMGLHPNPTINPVTIVVGKFQPHLAPPSKHYRISQMRGTLSLLDPLIHLLTLALTLHSGNVLSSAPPPPPSRFP